MKIYQLPSYYVVVKNCWWWDGRTPALVRHIRESNIVKTTKG